MNVNCLPSAISPSHRNIKTKNAIYKLMKKGSPKVRDMIREHCKQRWKDNRLNSQNKGRKLSLIEQTEDESIREEIKIILNNYNDEDLPGPENVDQFLKMFDLTDQEIGDAELFSKNEDAITNFQVERLYSDEIIVCPICDTGALSSFFDLKTNKYTCDCDNCFVEMQLDHSLNELECKIRSSWNDHAKNCRSLPKFRLDYCPQTLNMYCSSCGLCTSIF